MTRESEFSPPTAHQPEPELYSAHDDMASEQEVFDLLYGLVRIEKPRIVIETGTHQGWGAIAIGSALRANGRGLLLTFEREPDLAAAARGRILAAGLGSFVTVMACMSTSQEAIQAVHNLTTRDHGPGHGPGGATIDMFFSDSDPEGRVSEIEIYRGLFGPATIVAIHDTYKQAATIQPMRLDWGAFLTFRNPRGLMVGRLRAD